MYVCVVKSSNARLTPDSDAIEDLEEGRAARALKSKFSSYGDVCRDFCKHVVLSSPPPRLATGFASPVGLQLCLTLIRPLSFLFFPSFFLIAFHLVGLQHLEGFWVIGPLFFPRTLWLDPDFGGL